MGIIALLARIASGDYTIGVVGMGDGGLPLLPTYRGWLCRLMTLAKSRSGSCTPTQHYQFCAREVPFMTSAKATAPPSIFRLVRLASLRL